MLDEREKCFVDLDRELGAFPLFGFFLIISFSLDF